MVYDPVIAAVAIIHIGAGAAYFGSALVGEVLVTRVLRRTETVGEWRAHNKLFRPINQFDGATSMIALISGLVFLAVKYPPFDLGLYADLPNTRPLLIALGLFAVLLVLAFGVGMPIEKAAGALKLPDDPSAKPPPELLELVGRFGVYVHAQVVVVVTIMVLMVLAANGGF